MGTNFKGITATHKELTESGYFHTAKPIVLRNLWLENRKKRELRWRFRQLEKLVHESFD